MVEALRDSSKLVREVAKDALNTLREYEEQKRAWESFRKDGDKGGAPKSAAIALIEMLKHDELEVRIAAIKSLGKVADPSTLPILVKLVADGSPEERAAAQAAIDSITKDQ